MLISNMLKSFFKNVQKKFFSKKVTKLCFQFLVMFIIIGVEKKRKHLFSGMVANFSDKRTLITSKTAIFQAPLCLITSDEGTLKTPIPKCRLYWSFCLGGQAIL